MLEEALIKYGLVLLSNLIPINLSFLFVQILNDLDIRSTSCCFHFHTVKG